MPLTPSNGDEDAHKVVDVYRIAERALLLYLATSLTGVRGFGRPWYLRMLTKLPGFRSGVAKIVLGLADTVAVIIAAILWAAWRRGQRTAMQDIPNATHHDDDDAAQALVDRITDALTLSHRRIPITAESIYRRVVEEAGRDGVATTDDERQRIVQRALDRLVRPGITGLVDEHGRRYEMVGYAETTVRAAISYAEVQAYVQQAVANGHDLVIVSDVVGSCALCAPFESQVLSISGRTVGAITRDNSTGHGVTVTVMCSLEEARKRGLWHRNCRHTLRVWTPDNPAPPRAIRVPERERAAGRRRTELNRRLRERERVQRVAQTPEAQRDALRAVNAVRAQLHSL